MLSDDDISDLRAEDAWARKFGRALCPECGLRGSHSQGCPEAPEPDADEEGEE